MYIDLYIKLIYCTYFAVESNCPRAEANEHAPKENWQTATLWWKPAQMNPGI